MKVAGKTANQEMAALKTSSDYSAAQAPKLNSRRPKKIFSSH